MSTTPRTDYEAKRLDAWQDGKMFVHVDLARQLETELATMTLEKNLADARLEGIKRICAEREEQLRWALEPLRRIAEAFEKDGLDEARPSWGDTAESASHKELFGGRGGKQLLTLGDCIKASQVISQTSRK